MKRENQPHTSFHGLATNDKPKVTSDWARKQTKRVPTALLLQNVREVDGQH